MLSIQERLDEFAALSFDDQKAKMVLVLTDLQEADQVFVDLLDIIQHRTRVDSDFLVGTYHDIMDFAEAIRAHDKALALDKLSSLQLRIQEIHAQEEAERTQEHPDDLLNQI